MNKQLIVNPDLAKERHANFDIKAMTQFLGEMRLETEPGHYQYHLKLRKDIVSKIKPVYEENFYNLTRDQRYQMVLKKSLEVCEYARDNNIDLKDIMMFAGNAIFGADSFTFGLHLSAFEVCIDLWGTEAQSKHWQTLIKNKALFGTYVQTEIGHGTNLRGLETTATLDKITGEFIINSPTETSRKFWPGASAKTCNHAVVMANLIIDGVGHGLHGFVVQLRSMEDHKTMPNIELLDIGMKAGFDTQDNGCIRFNNVRIPLNNMLMRNSRVTPDGQYTKIGNELIMYASMLCLRAILGTAGTFYMAASTTIAIRYSCVRRQTAIEDGTEAQIIDYKTQQYRLFPALATTYAFHCTSTWYFRDMLLTKAATNDFESITPDELNQIHALTAGMKAMAFNNALKFSQSNRLCCGGHGYSLASGIPQIIQNTDAGSTYEGDNVILLLQTARYLLKCAQKGVSPHKKNPNETQLKQTNLYQSLSNYFTIYTRLYEESMTEITNKMMHLVMDKGMGKLAAWNECSGLLVNVAKIYINIFVLNAFVAAIESHKVEVNRRALIDLFELFALYDICDTFSANVLRLQIIEPHQMTEYNESLNELLSKIRANAVHLVDAFDFLDCNLCSALGAYDGQAYERLMEFARNSEFNKSDVHEAYEKYQKPYALRLNRMSKL